MTTLHPEEAPLSGMRHGTNILFGVLGALGSTIALTELMDIDHNGVREDVLGGAVATVAGSVIIIGLSETYHRLLRS